ncbi:hypothetical protein MMC17_006760 [Xylographa soralifera]|nr:hypothetical protein [Xylographa soralifera]
MTSKPITRSRFVHPPTTIIKMPSYKYEDAFYPNSNYPLGSLAPLGSYANPYPRGQSPNNQPAGSTRPVASTNTTVREFLSSPEVHTWSPPAPIPASPSDPEALLHFGSETAPGSLQLRTVGRLDPSLSTTGQAPLPTNVRQTSYSASTSRPAPSLPTIGHQQLTAIINDPQHVHFSEGGTQGVYRNPQQARSGLALIPERSNTERAVRAAADGQHNSSALQIARRGLPAQNSDVPTRLDIERAVASIHQPHDQTPRHVHHACPRAPTSFHRPMDGVFAEDTARVIIAQLLSLLPENQPGSRTNARETAHHPIPIDGGSSTETPAINDMELRKTKQGRPWELCEICKKKPHLVTEKRIKFCHSCYGEAVAAEKALSRRRARGGESREG